MSGELIANPRRLTERIKTHIASVQQSLDELVELIAEAYDGRVWEPLGYSDWDSYIRAEFYSVGRLRLTRDERRDLVVGLRSQGMSTRAIGTALGVSHTEVQRSGGTNVPPAPVTGLDGKEYEPVQVQHSTTTTEKTTETQAPVMVNPATGEVVDETQPSEAVTDYLESDAEYKRAQYIHEFMKVRTRSDDFMEFEPEKIAACADLEVGEFVDNYLIRVRTWTERFHAAVGGLRVVNGGRQ
ncbi:MAG: helix-turn-helix domain-containing protein [Streptosporangiales bacterium]